LPIHDVPQLVAHTWPGERVQQQGIDATQMLTNLRCG
jgi:hypothetical protein